MTTFNQISTQKVATARSTDDTARIDGTVRYSTRSNKMPASRDEIEVRAAQVKLGWSAQERRSRRRAGRLAFIRLARLLD